MAPDRRRRLMEVAAQEFATAGYEQASLNRILGACGLSKSSFYYYVRSKQELFDLVVEEVGGALVEAVAVPPAYELAAGGFWEGLAELLPRLAGLAEREPAFADLGRLFYLPGVPSEVNGALPRAQAAIEAWLSAALAAGRASGAVRRDLPIALQAQLTLAMLRTLDEWSLSHAEDLHGPDGDRLLQAQFAGLRRLLGPD